jgi:hypothetical protein
MKYILIIIFVASVSFAVLGNAIVYIILVHRKVPLRSFWAGTPGYLYRVCVNSPSVGTRLRRFAFSTNIAFLTAIVLGIGLIPMFQQ